MRVNPIAVVVLSAALCGTGLAYTSSVPVGLTGAPGEETCADCHDNLNNGSGAVTVTAPLSFSPGETLGVFVQVHHMGQKKWGFELTCLDDLDEPAGQIVVTDPARTQLDVNDGNGRQYIMHTAAGTDEGHMDMCLGWSFDWIAPAVARPQVTFYVAAVAANDGSGSNGDYVYTETLSAVESPVDESTWGRIKQLYR